MNRRRFLANGIMASLVPFMPFCKKKGLVPTLPPEIPPHLPKTRNIGIHINQISYFVWPTDLSKKERQRVEQKVAEIRQLYYSPGYFSFTPASVYSTVHVEEEI